MTDMCEQPEFIWKFNFEIIPLKQTVLMPPCFEVIHVGIDPNGNPAFWALVATKDEPVPVEFYVLGTGARAPDIQFEHIGSFMQAHEWMWHVFMNLSNLHDL